MRFEITGRNQFKALGVLIMGTMMMLLILLYFRFERSFLIVFSIMWLVYAIPTLILHVEYYFKNKNQIVEITNEDIKLFENGVEKINFQKQDIDKIELYKSGNLEARQIQFFAMESYHFAKIRSKQGDEIFITCLLTPDVEMEIKKLNDGVFERRRRFYVGIDFSF